MAESYKSVICSIFLGKPNSLSVLRYNLLTFRWPVLQTAYYPPTLATNNPHMECTHTHTHTSTGSKDAKAMSVFFFFLKEKSEKCMCVMYKQTHKCLNSGCNGLIKGKEEKGKRMVDGMTLCIAGKGWFTK